MAENKETIVIADDDPLNRHSMSGFAEVTFPNYHHLFCEDTQTLEALLKKSRDISLVITGLNMRGEMSERVIATYSPRVPFVLCTGDHEEGERIRDSYKIAYLPKPFDLKDFKHATRTVLLIYALREATESSQ